jgi:predicted SAM-dependent methyltransferase
VKLYIGCGHKRIHGFKHIDIDPNVQPDIVDDCRLTRLKYTDIEYIYTCHTFEHLQRREAQTVLDVWYHALRPGGMLRISVPDFQAIAEYYICYKDLSVLQNMLHGDLKNEFQVHYASYDEKTLTAMLVKVGFKDIKRYDPRKTEHGYIDDLANARLPHMDLANGKLMSLNLECIKEKPSVIVSVNISGDVIGDVGVCNKGLIDG